MWPCYLCTVQWWLCIVQCAVVVDGLQVPPMYVYVARV